MIEPSQKGPNKNPGDEEALITEGARWLELLGMQEMAGLPIVVDGRQYRLEEFPLAYSGGKYMERVHPLLLKLEQDSNDEEIKSGMRKILMTFYEKYRVD